MKKFIVPMLLTFAMCACSSSTIINSSPSGASLYLNGEKVGLTPYIYSDKKIVGSTTSVVLKKEGYADLNSSFSRNEEVSAGAIVGGLFVLVPFLWVMEYKPNRSYEMTPLKGAVAP